MNYPTLPVGFQTGHPDRRVLVGGVLFLRKHTLQQHLHRTCGFSSGGRTDTWLKTHAFRQALKEAQACYLDGCGCETPCAAEDQAEACPSSGKLSDPINFWEPRPLALCAPSALRSPPDAVTGSTPLGTHQKKPRRNREEDPVFAVMDQSRCAV